MTKSRIKPSPIVLGSASRMGEKVNLAGIPLTVAPDDAAEDADMVVCMPANFPSPFHDNVTAPCAQCGEPIIYRPHVPKRPAKVCISCALPLAGPVAGHA